MRTRKQREERPDELVTAIGLVWGHLNARQFGPAHALARGCMELWPHDRALILMCAYAAAELMEPIDDARLSTLQDAECADWIRLVRLRAAPPGHAEPDTQPD